MRTKPVSPSNKKPSLEEMQKNIRQAGGLFYQYRPCRRSAATIYDIDNIRRGVVYAQTPLNMNDPFDSIIGFSAEKFYDDAISMIMEALNMDNNLKHLMASLIKHKAFGNLAELIYLLNDLKDYITKQQVIMHKANMPVNTFVLANSKQLYSKCPKAIKKSMPLDMFLAFSVVISRYNGQKITESTISNMFQMDSTLDEFQKMIEKIRDTEYIPNMQKFLSHITVSCFSASGWNNQLMWSHYANSYAGFCIEYDFSKINDFIGFIYPVHYTKERPTLSLNDLGVVAVDLTKEDTIVRDEVNIQSFFSYILSKNTCWEYEDEWRIINIGEAYTPKFINLPYIKSITLGLNMDKLCRRLIIDICKEKSINCYQIELKKDTFELERSLINFDEIEFNIDEELEYIELIGKHVNDYMFKIEQESKKSQVS